ncbi:quorum-sensing-regulated virulence factor family protein [Stutzerimonas stutzeri]|uniref:quorum-sensing-regulated virulence factor family protein n=1 Tax=Stutzerimonas sp. S1 TaxID=3030652 RepID=UPI002224BEA2|nr:quorum-sensing-regulated virulence factor family protein [Stutzerimonas sp. S1]MCW3149088.1 quorum-sensing-regulated virulence factor family protein [Stutzerimonas sp. S1]
MHRLTPLLLLSLALPTAHAASLQDPQLDQLLNQVAQQSSVGTPRAINEDILDQGYTVDNNELVNHLSVQPRHAAQMRDNPAQVRSQLQTSVCGNQGLRTLLSKGAVLRYEFSEYKSNKPITTERYNAADCGI